eukprot:170327-Pyramimonas_sp.AAC.1
MQDPYPALAPRDAQSGAPGRADLAPTAALAVCHATLAAGRRRMRGAAHPRGGPLCGRARRPSPPQSVGRARG